MDEGTVEALTAAQADVIEAGHSLFGLLQLDEAELEAAPGHPAYTVRIRAAAAREAPDDFHRFGSEIYDRGIISWYGMEIGKVLAEHGLHRWCIRMPKFGWFRDIDRGIPGVARKEDFLRRCPVAGDLRVGPDAILVQNAMPDLLVTFLDYPYSLTRQEVDLYCLDQPVAMRFDHHLTVSVYAGDLTLGESLQRSFRACGVNGGATGAGPLPGPPPGSRCFPAAGAAPLPPRGEPESGEGPLRIESLLLNGLGPFQWRPCWPSEDDAALGEPSRRSGLLRLGETTWAVGEPGSGKSFVARAFELLSFLAADGFVAATRRLGGASALVHHGAPNAPQVNIRVRLNNGHAYCAVLDDCVGLGIRIRAEWVTPPGVSAGNELLLGTDLKDSLLREFAGRGGNAAYLLGGVLDVFGGIRVMKPQNFDIDEIRAGGPLKFFTPNISSPGVGLAELLAGVNATCPAEFAKIDEMARCAWPRFMGMELAPAGASQGAVVWRDAGHPAAARPLAQLPSDLARLLAAAALLNYAVSGRAKVVVVDRPDLCFEEESLFAFAKYILARPWPAQIIVTSRSEPIPCRRGVTVIRLAY